MKIYTLTYFLLDLYIHGNCNIEFNESFILLNDNVFFYFFVSDLYLGGNHGYDTIIRVINEWFIRKTLLPEQKIERLNVIPFFQKTACLAFFS